MVVVLLTALSWITFIMDPSDLSDRCGISLTLLLALNVFQLILSELMPKTGYLTPMHEAGALHTFHTFHTFHTYPSTHSFIRSTALAGFTAATYTHGSIQS